MNASIHLNLFATLKQSMPPGADNYPIQAGSSVAQILRQLDIPPDKAKLIFVDGVKGSLQTILQGGERVGVFPPVGGG